MKANQVAWLFIAGVAMVFITAILAIAAFYVW
jgi:hypothetical protein